MHWLSFVGLLFSLVFIVIEDFKIRRVRIAWFGFVFLFASTYAYYFIGLEKLLLYSVINLGFLSIQALLLVGYFILKHKRWINLTESYIGWGDVLFMLVIVSLFSPLSFILYYLSSLILALCIVLIYSLKGKALTQIPLAGIQALYLTALLCWNQFYKVVLFIDDFEILNKL